MEYKINEKIIELVHDGKDVAISARYHTNKTMLRKLLEKETKQCGGGRDDNQ